MNARLAAVIGLHLVAAIGGFLAWRLSVPLPWMIGPLVTVAVITILFNAPPVPRAGRYIGQTVVASSVGLYLTPEALQRIAESAVPLVLAAGLTMVAGSCIAATLARAARVDWPTALFSGIPGGPVEMANLAERYGGIGSQVAFAQTIRITAIVLLVPPTLVLLGGPDGDRVLPPGSEFDVLGFSGALALSAAGGLVLHLMGSSNAFFLGPMAVLGALTAAGYHLSGIPGPVIAAGQVLLGVSLGAMFSRQNLMAAGHFILTAVWTTALLLMLSSGIAALLWWAFDLPFRTMIVATAPGSLTEMVVTARVLSLDVPLVAAFHLSRVFLLVAFVPVAYRMLSWWLSRRSLNG